MEWYNVRPIELLYLSRDHVMNKEDVGKPPIGLTPKVEDNDFFRGDVNSSDLEDKLYSKDDGASKGFNGANKESAEANNAYFDQPLWRGKNYDLLNDDLSFFRKAKIVVCLSDKPFDEENLGDINAQTLFFFDGDLQKTSFWSPLVQVRSKGGRFLSKIVTICFEHAKSFKEDFGLKSVLKNPYHHIK